MDKIVYPRQKKAQELERSYKRLLAATKHSEPTNKGNSGEEPEAEQQMHLPAEQVGDAPLIGQDADMEVIDTSTKKAKAENKPHHSAHKKKNKPE